MTAKYKQSYREKLLDPRWQKKRLEILSRDEFTCQICGDKETTLHVHHKFYNSGAEPWEYRDGALVTVCANCHEPEAEFTKEVSRTLTTTILGCGANADEMLSIAGAFNSCATLTKEDFAVLAYIIEGYGVSDSIREALQNIYQPREK